MRMNPNENQVKDRIKIERSEYNPVPLYRSYGVTTRERPLLTKIKIIAQKALATCIFGLVFFTLAVGAIAFTFASGSVILPTAVLSSVATFFLLKYSKPARKRIKMVSRLKKLCKGQGYKQGYRLEMSDGILSPKWSDGRGELIFYTNTRVYHIRMFSVRKYRSRLSFESESEITVTTPPLRNVFTTIYDLTTNYKKMTVDFSGAFDSPGRDTVRAVVICPTCSEWSYRQSLNSYVPTGNAETVFGYKVYTASGFISDMIRTEEA